VRREELPAVQAQLQNYARLRKLVDQWIDLGIELSTLRLEESRERARE
jgi:hypothetical protein